MKSSTEGIMVIDEGWAAFPGNKWMGVFESAGVHAGESDWDSRLFVYWFRPGLPGNLDRRVAEGVAKLDWDALAEDFYGSWQRQHAIYGIKGMR